MPGVPRDCPGREGAAGHAELAQGPEDQARRGGTVSTAVHLSVPTTGTKDYIKT